MRRPSPATRISLLALHRKDAAGRVSLRGLVTNRGRAPAPEGVIAFLPAGYRPVARMAFAVDNGASMAPAPANVHGRVDVLPNGEVRWNGPGRPGYDVNFTSLDTISFYTD